MIWTECNDWTNITTNTLSSSAAWLSCVSAIFTEELLKFFWGKISMSPSTSFLIVIVVLKQSFTDSQEIYNW